MSETKKDTSEENIIKDSSAGTESGDDKKTASESAGEVGETESSKRSTNAAGSDNIQSTEAVGEESNSKTTMLIALGAIIVIAAIGIFLLSSNGGDGRYSDAEVLSKATQLADGAMRIAESERGIDILPSQAKVTSNSTNYLISMPVEGSEEYAAFDVLLDLELKNPYVGFDGKLTSIDNFMGLQQGLDVIQKCAKAVNERDFIQNLVLRWYEGTSKQMFITTIPKTIECEGTNYTYSLEIGDGHIKTTLYDDHGQGHYVKSSFAKGIVQGGVVLPASAIQKGVFVYVNRVRPYKLAYTYQLRDKSIVTYDAYGGPLVSTYNISAVPSLVWNCKYVNVGSKALAERNGSVVSGTEEYALATLACIFNKGQPSEICSQLGILQNENGDINAQIPTDYALTMYQTALSSCKPDNNTVKVEAFYTLDCPDCDAQRAILEDLSDAFGEYMNLTYYCIGKQDKCQSFIDAAS